MRDSVALSCCQAMCLRGALNLQAHSEAVPKHEGRRCPGARSLLWVVREAL